MENGFIITAMQLFHLDKKSAEEFLEVYKGVVPEFQVPLAFDVSLFLF